MTLRIVLSILVNFVASLVLTAGAGAEPGEHWERADPATTEWAAPASRQVAAYGAAHRPTAVMIVHDGRIVADWGDVGRKVNVRSVRKSLLGALYGIMA